MSSLPKITDPTDYLGNAHELASTINASLISELNQAREDGYDMSDADENTLAQMALVGAVNFLAVIADRLKQG